MGYWQQTKDGHSLTMEDTGLIWGDQPADIMGAALDEIIRVFTRDRGCLPTEAEVKAGLMFSLPHALEKAQDSFEVVMGTDEATGLPKVGLVEKEGS